jgi:uncharacterized protein (TIGR00661 family)
MAKIFYSMSGEGRGHASRVATIVARLQLQHDLTLFAPDQAYEYLTGRNAAGHGPGTTRVHAIPGLRFHYTGGRINLVKTLLTGLEFWRRSGPIIRSVGEMIGRERPDLVITDFEPLLPRAARCWGVPCLSLDHQHFLTTFDLGVLPRRLRIAAWLMRWVVATHCPWPRQVAVTSFFHAPLRRGHQQTRLLGPIVREQVRRATLRSGDYLVSYIRPQTPPHVIRVLRNAPCEVRVYGAGQRGREGRLRWRAFDATGFAEDLAGCRALVGAAGNQTLGEALYLGKPVLALPERRHFEQNINAHFLALGGWGRVVTAEDFETSHLQGFLAELDSATGAATERVPDGTAAAVRLIEELLPPKSTELTGMVA